MENILWHEILTNRNRFFPQVHRSAQGLREGLQEQHQEGRDRARVLQITGASPSECRRCLRSIIHQFYFRGEQRAGNFVSNNNQLPIWHQRKVLPLGENNTSERYIKFDTLHRINYWVRFTGCIGSILYTKLKLGTTRQFPYWKSSDTVTVGLSDTLEGVIVTADYCT